MLLSPLNKGDFENALVPPIKRDFENALVPPLLRGARGDREECGLLTGTAFDIKLKPML
jgi:hypothetical protein